MAEQASNEIKMEEEVTTNELGERVVPASKIRKAATPNQHIVLADGSSYKGQAARNDSYNELWVWVEAGEGIDMAHLFPVFNDPEKTARIESWILDDREPTVYEGYTRMNVIKMDAAGKVSIRLMPGN